MNETAMEADRQQTDAELRAAGRNYEPRLEETEALSGMEINLGDFTRTQGLMKSLRLTLNNQIVIPVEEIAGGLNDAARKFKMGDLEQESGQGLRARQELVREFWRRLQDGGQQE